MRDDLPRRGDPAAAVQLDPRVVRPVERTLLRGFPRAWRTAPDKALAENVFRVYGGAPVKVRKKRAELPRRIFLMELPQTVEIALRKTERAKLREIVPALACRRAFRLRRRGRLRRGRRFLRRGERHVRRRDIPGLAAGLLYVIPERAVFIRLLREDRNGAAVRYLARRFAARSGKQELNARWSVHRAGSDIRGMRPRRRHGKQQHGKRQRKSLPA